MPITIEERTRLAAYQAAQDDIRATITNGVLPNTEKALRQYAAFGQALADSSMADIAAQYGAELAEVGLTTADLGELVAALTNAITVIKAKDTKSGGRLFALPVPQPEGTPV